MPRVLQVIESEELRGSGRHKFDIARRVLTYHTLDGDLLAEKDPCPDVGVVILKDAFQRAREKGVLDEAVALFSKLGYEWAAEWTR